VSRWRKGISKLLTATDLRRAKLAMYPDVEGEGNDNSIREHSMIAVVIVLLSAALLNTIEDQRLLAFTGYSPFQRSR